MRALILLALPAAVAAAPAPTTLSPGAPIARIDQLKPGTHHYLRYRVSADGRVTVSDYQTKTIARDGKVMTITQRWQGDKNRLDIVSHVDATTLAPIDHQRVRTSGEKAVTEDFRFAGAHITGSTLTREGALQPVDQNGPLAPYNFEIDLETLAALSWSKGQAYLIPFYHPGGDAPKLYRFEARGETTLRVGGVPIEAWLVTTDYGRPEFPPARFLISKKDGTVLRVESPLPDGGLIVKALLVTP